MNEQFLSWLASNESGPCCFRENATSYIFIRVEKNADFDYLFSQSQYRDVGMTRGSSFKYAGVYFKQNGLIYDGEYDLRGICGEELDTRSAEKMQEQLQTVVRDKVEAAIGNDRRNLQITEITDQSLLNNLEYAYKYSAKEDARKAYLDTVEFEKPTFRCWYEPEHWTEDSLLAYILDPEGYAEKELAAYIADNQEDMLFSFLRNDAVLKEYRALLADTENPVHSVKKIMAALSATLAKTVNVTIRKNGEEFTFKTETDPLRRDCSSYYSTWSIVAADRRGFERRFGRSSDYHPEEILRITYGKAVLYEANA